MPIACNFYSWIQNVPGMTASPPDYEATPYAPSTPSAPDMAVDDPQRDLSLAGLSIDNPEGPGVSCQEEGNDRQQGHVMTDPEPVAMDQTSSNEAHGETQATAPSLDLGPQSACNGMCMPPCYQCVMNNPQYSDAWLSAEPMASASGGATAPPPDIRVQPSNIGAVSNPGAVSTPGAITKDSKKV